MVSFNYRKMFLWCLYTSIVIGILTAIYGFFKGKCPIIEYIYIKINDNWSWYVYLPIKISRLWDFLVGPIYVICIFMTDYHLSKQLSENPGAPVVEMKFHEIFFGGLLWGLIGGIFLFWGYGLAGVLFSISVALIFVGIVGLFMIISEFSFFKD